MRPGRASAAAARGAPRRGGLGPQLLVPSRPCSIFCLPARRPLRAHGGAHLAGVTDPMPLLVWIVLCAALGGIAGAVLAVVFLWIPRPRAERTLPHFVSFATGALLGAALLALLPEAMAGAGVAGAHTVGLTLIAGLGVVFVL